jgi:hypothetical protein
MNIKSKFSIIIIIEGTNFICSQTLILNAKQNVRSSNEKNVQMSQVLSTILIIVAESES